MGKPVHVVAALVFLRRDDRILLVKWRAKGGYWSLPGGAVEAGESIEQAAMREALEETGLSVKIIRVVGIYSKPAETTVAVTLEGEIVGGTLVRQTGETVDAAFFPMDSLPEHVLPHLPRRVADFRSGQSEAFFRRE